MNPATEEQQRQIAELKQAIDHKAKRVNHPVGMLLTYSLGFALSALFYELCPPLQSLGRVIIQPMLWLVLYSLSRIDILFLSRGLVNKFIEEEIQETAQNFGVSVDVLPQDKINLLYVKVRETLSPTIQKIEDGLSESFKVIFTDVADVLSSNFLILAGATLIHQYFTKPKMTRWYPAGIFTRQALPDSMPITDQDANTIINQLTDVNTKLDINLRRTKTITRIILPSVLLYQWLLYLELERPLPITQAFVSLLEFSYTVSDPSSVIGRACLISAAYEITSDVRAYLRSFNVDTRLHRIEQQFKRFSRETKCINCTLVKKKNIDDSYLKLLLRDSNSESYSQRSFFEYLALLLKTHGFQPSLIRHRVIHIPARELPEIKHRQLVYLFRLFEERYNSNQKNAEAFEKAINELVKKALLLNYFMGSEKYYSADNLNLPVIDSIGISFRSLNDHDEIKRNQLNAAILICFPGIEISEVEKSSGYSLIVSGCPIVKEECKQSALNSINISKKSFDASTSSWVPDGQNLFRTGKPKKRNKGKSDAKSEEEKQANPIIKKVKSPVWPKRFLQTEGVNVCPIENSEGRGGDWYSFFPVPQNHFYTDNQYDAFSNGAKHFATKRNGTQGIVNLRYPLTMTGLLGKFGVYTHEVKKLGKQTGYVRVLGRREEVEADGEKKNIIIFDALDLTAHS